MEFIVSQTDTRGIFWVAHLDDGTVISQNYGGSYATLPRDHLQAFDLWQNGRILCRVDLREDELGKRSLIYRRRTQMRTDGSPSTHYYMVGWQRTVAGFRIQAINYIFEDGSILLGGQFIDDELMGAIEPFEWERDI